MRKKLQLWLAINVDMATSFGVNSIRQELVDKIEHLEQEIESLRDAYIAKQKPEPVKEPEPLALPGHQRFTQRRAAAQGAFRKEAYMSPVPKP